MIYEEYKETVLHYDDSGDPDTELLIRLWENVHEEEAENFYRLALINIMLVTHIYMLFMMSMVSS